MKLLVACPRKLLLVDCTSSDVQLVETHRGEYYGISWTEDGRSLCLGHSGVENASLSTLETYMDSEWGWISYGEVQGPAALSATHQVWCAGDRVIATNTGRNCLTIFRTDDWFYRHYWLDDVRWDRKGREDLCGSHFNSVFLQDDVLYVVAHNHNRGSSLIRLAWPEMRILSTHRTTTLMAHNVWATSDGELIVCDSMRGTIVDVAADRILWQCEIPNVVTRGLASNGEYVFVGHSAIGTREARVNRDGRIWVIDRMSWKTVDSILLPGSGNVHDLRIVDEPDLCHHGHVFYGEIATLGRLGDSALLALGEGKSAALLPLGEGGRRPDEGARPPAETAPSPHPPLRDDLSRARERCDSRQDDHSMHRWEQHAPFTQFDGRRGTAGNFSLATLANWKASDVVVRAQVDARNPATRHVGLVARYQGPGDRGMIVALIAQGDASYRAQLWQHHDNQWSCLKSANLRRGVGVLELKVVGQVARVSFNGAKLFEATVAGSVAEGRVGVRAARGTFADFQASPLATASAADHPRAA
jgi:hypothetical protein